MKEKWYIVNQMDEVQLIESTSVMIVNFNWFWWSLLYLCNVYIDPCTNNCHPGWLVAGSIPVMTSYGYGFGNSQMVYV